MRKLLQSSFLWQVAGGFVLGTVGMVALQPADATHTLASRFAPHHHVAH